MKLSKKPYFCHPSSTVEGESEDNGFCDPNIGVGTKIWHYVHVRAGAKIGERCQFGQASFVGSTAIVGNGCKIQNKVNIYEGVQLEDYVFCGPSMTFTNLSSPLPRAAISRLTSLQSTRVKTHASIGAQAVIVCGTVLGQGCFVAAGATVIRDVPDYALMAGVPARQIGWVCECGARLELNGTGGQCTSHENIYGRAGTEVFCERRYELQPSDRLVKVYDPHENV